MVFSFECFTCLKMLNLKYILLAILLFTKTNSNTNDDLKRRMPNLDKNELTKKQQVSVETPLFQPKLTEPPNEDDYRHEYEDYYYDDADYPPYEPFDPNSKKKPDAKTSTSSPKWIVNNSTSPTGPNLKHIFDFVEFFLRPTNPNENTIEVSLSSRSKANESETIQQSSDYFQEEYKMDSNEKRF